MSLQTSRSGLEADLAGLAFSTSLVVVPQPVATASYTGPGDLAAGATAWWGLRAFSAANCTGSQKAIQLKRASDGTTQDIVILTTGDLDVASATAFLAATTGTAVKFYDQTGNGWDLSTASGPPFNLANLGTLPTVGSATAVAWTTPVSASFTPASGVLTISLVARRDGTTSSTVNMVRVGNISNILVTVTTGGNWRLGTNTVLAAAGQGAWHAANGAINGASSVLMIDGADTAGSATGSVTAGTMQVFPASATNGLRYVEAGVWDALALDATTRGNIDANQRAYWGI